MPITKINGKPVGSGVPGKITRELHKTYWYKHSDPDWSLSVDDILKKWKNNVLIQIGFNYTLGI